MPSVFCKHMDACPEPKLAGFLARCPHIVIQALFTHDTSVGSMPVNFQGMFVPATFENHRVLRKKLSFVHHSYYN